MKSDDDLLSSSSLSEPWIFSFGVSNHLLEHLTMFNGSTFEPLFILQPGFTEKLLLKHHFVVGIQEGMVPLTSNPHLRQELHRRSAAEVAQPNFFLVAKPVACRSKSFICPLLVAKHEQFPLVIGLLIKLIEDQCANA